MTICPTPEEWSVIALSVRVSLTAVLVTLPFGIYIAHRLARGRQTFRFLVDNLIQLPLVLPPVVTGYLLLLLLGPAGPVGRLLPPDMQIAFTWVGAAFASAVVSFPLLVQTIRVAFEQIDPSWEEMVRVYGGGRWDAFRYVTLPLAARGVTAALVLAFARAFGEFGATIVVAGNIAGKTRTLPLAIFSKLNQINGEQAALRLVMISVVVSVASLAVHATLSRRLHRRSG